jgi:DNA polymerase III subunit gamma/tau
MTYQVLARKWRPKNFDQVVGQSAIVRSLKNAIKSKTFSQAYLLTGTRGIGKTSVARIIAKALRCERAEETGNPCLQCPPCLEFESDQTFNIIEIDGASNNSVDNIRDLIDNVQYLPTSGRYKVYIIDEVHMLSASAFNALLKTLEEPPAHVVFIFATTEPHKVLDTILSRCQRLDFQNADTKTLIDHLERVAKEEGIKFESKSTIYKIAVLADGSFRDALSYLDQVLIYAENRYISDQVILEALGVPSELEMVKLFRAILEANYGEVKNICQLFFHKNVAVKSIVRELLDLGFAAIESIDELEKHPHFKDISSVVAKNLSLAELVWIYETLNRDAEWVMNSLSSSKSFLVCLKKITWRHTFFTKKISKKEVVEVASDDQRSDEAAASDPAADSTQFITMPDENLSPVAKLQEETSVIESKKEKSWEGFLNYLSGISPAQAANLEQGNLLAPLKQENDRLTVDLGFNQTEEVFFEYLQEPASKNKLMGRLSDYFALAESCVALNLKLINHEEKEQKNFKSQREIYDEQEGQVIEQKREQFLQDQRIKEMEQIFGSKIDRVIIQE